VQRAAERSLERALGGPVRLGSARFSFGRGLAFEATGLEAWPQPGGPALRVERVAAGIEPLSLLLGRVQLRRLVLDEARLRLVRGADGRLSPSAPLAALLGERAAPEPHAGGAWGVVERVGNTARGLLQAPLPLLRAALAPRQTELRRSRVLLVDERAEAQIALEDIEGFLVRHARGSRLELGGSARLMQGDRECGWVTLEGDTRGGSGDLALGVRHVELRAIAPWLRELHPDLSVTGIARGALRVGFGDRDARRVRAEVLVGKLDARVPRRRGQQPFALRGDAASAAAELEVTRDRVELLQGELELDGQRLQLAGDAKRPLRSDAPARLAVGVRNLELERARQLLRLLPDELERRLAAPLGRVERGRLTQLEVAGTGTLADWRETLESPVDGRTPPLALEGTARFREVSLRLGEADLLEGLSGEVSLAPDRLEVRGLRRPRNVPQLDVTIDGLDRLLDEGERVATGAPALPGLAPLVEYWSGGPPAPDGPRAELGRVELAIDWLAHPLAVWPFEDLAVVVGPLEQGARRLEGRGAWAGLGVRGSGTWEPSQAGAPGRIAVRLEVGGRASHPTRRAEWAAGTWRVIGGHWRGLAFDELRGRFRGEGPRLRIGDGEARLAQGGPLRGGVVFDLSRADEVPSEIELVAQSAALGEFGALAGLARGDLVGQLDGAVHLAGPLRPGVSARRTLAGRLSLAVGRGELRRRPAMAQAIATSDDAFEEFGEKKPFKFESAQVELALADGHLATDALLIRGSKARLVVSGRVRVDAPPHEVEAVVGVFPRNAMNSIVGNVPVIGPILRGSDGSVVGAYLELTGPWGDPHARRLRNRSLAAGMLEGVPSFVLNGLRAIGSVLARLGPDSGDPPGGGS
jgi:hypothetical protein